MKKKYEKPIAEINRFECEDVITTSSITGFKASIFALSDDGINSVDL